MNISKLSKRHEYINILLKIQRHIPSAIIAGGVLRDQYHNKEVNDIDIYVPNIGTAVLQEKFWKQIFDLRIGKLFSHDRIRLITPDDEDGYKEKDYIEEVWEITKNRIDYNIIIVSVDPIEYVNKYFDIGLCKAYCDGTKIHFTADFMHDSRFKYLTLVAQDVNQESFDRMMDNHIYKLQEKYPGYKLIIPSEYEGYYNEYNNYE